MQIPLAFVHFISSSETQIEIVFFSCRKQQLKFIKLNTAAQHHHPAAVLDDEK